MSEPSKAAKRRDRIGNSIATVAGNAAQLERLAYGLADSLLENDQKTQTAIDAAVLAERERCAKLVDVYGLEQGEKSLASYDAFYLYELAAESISDLIRALPQVPDEG